jgi:hypothetical protein
MESEPNNTPADAMHLSGEVLIMGSIAGSDQDAFLWTVSDVDALKRWTFKLQGIPGRLTIVEIVRLEYADDGIEVTDFEKLMKKGTRDGRIPSIHEDLMFEPGEYLLGLAAAGGGGGAFRPPTASLSFGDKDDDAWADWPVRISARAIDAGGGHAETYQEITAGRASTPVNPQWGWTVPEALRGGFNVAWAPVANTTYGLRSRPGMSCFPGTPAQVSSITSPPSTTHWSHLPQMQSPAGMRST